MLGGILAFLTQRRAFCAWEKAIGGPSPGAWEDGGEGGLAEEGVFQ